MSIFGVCLRALGDEPERGPFLPSGGHGFLPSEWLLRERPIPLFGRHLSAEGGRIINGSRSRSSRRRERRPSFSSLDCLQRTLLAAATFLSRLVDS